ncbi:MAG: Rrf2 family transcriptional regulator [Balneolaceae bacterium]
MLLSKSCVYGIRASLYLASRKEGEYNSIKAMSETLDISFHFLTKILQQLTARDLMESYKGPNGGIKLSQDGRKATLLDIVIAIDGSGMFTECALGLPGCGSNKPCPLHDSWATTRDHIKEMLDKTNIIEMSKAGKAGDLRLTDDLTFHWE